MIALIPTLADAALAAGETAPAPALFAVELIPLYGGVLVALIGGFFALTNRRGSERAARNDMKPPTWSEAFEMITSAQRESSAALAKATIAEASAASAHQRANRAEDVARQLGDSINRLRAVFRQYVDRVQAGGSNALTDAERASLDEGDHILERLDSAS